MTRDPRRRLPAMDRLLDEAAADGWDERWGREAAKRALRQTLARRRAALGDADADDPGGAPDAAHEPASILDEARRLLERRARPTLRRVLNGTGVVLHTNLGRAPLADGAVDAVAEVGAGYANLEYDLESGERGDRHVHCAGLLRELTGAEAALVVNNNAAAVALAVHALAAGREVVVSRGELVEIGGSFRMPEVIAASGARLVEVGTTNRTRLEDYRRALGPETGALLKVHPSNYRVEGFVRDVALDELVALGREHDLPVVFDLGSGLLRSELLPGFPAEPSPGEAVAAGADLVTWSGDKLLGGPQAGLVCGRAEAVGRLRDDPLLRTFRVGKTTLAGLEATLRPYRRPERATDLLPALRMLTEGAARVRERAVEAASDLELPGDLRLEVAETEAVVGGGAYPGHRIPSAGWRVSGVDPGALAAACRAHAPPMVGIVREGAFWVDFRTLLPGQEDAAGRILLEAVRRIEGGAARGARRDEAGTGGREAGDG